MISRFHIFFSIIQRLVRAGRRRNHDVLALAMVFILGLSPSASAQFRSGFNTLPGFSENTSPQRIGDAHRFAKAKNKLTGCVRVEDEIWLVSTRQLCQRTSPELDSTFQQAEVAQQIDGQWLPSTAEALLSAINNDQERWNLLFIHGNRTDLQWANLRGEETYEALISGASASQCTTNPAPPVRWIIWAWNSDPLHVPRVDLAVKKQRAIDQGTYLAEFFQGVARPEMGVFAYSLGAQALASSLRARQTAASVHPEKPMANNLDTGASPLECAGPALDVVMVAGAVPTCWFNTVDAQTCLPPCVNRLTLINNPEDRALHIYQRFTRQQPIGLHSTQVNASVPTETFIVSGNSLDNHYLSRYLEHSGTRQLIRQGLLPLGP
ncbi:MAG: hypothetical protein JNL67_01100 [Planctomycetaceae bacterium]|nr:hypothetical protein [Planctomycetaceae bacterium]